ncbi:MAG: hypothetical protein ACMV1D_05295, partial [Macromonas sp.]
GAPTLWHQRSDGVETLSHGVGFGWGCGMTPAQEQALIAATAAGLDNDLRAAFADLLERIQRGEEPRAATEAVMLAFSGQYAAVMRTALAGIMANAMGDASPVPITTSAVQLSARLYAQAPAVSGVVASIVNAHQQGFQDARALTLQLFEGYGFRPPSQEPLQINPRNQVLPKYLRELVRDPGLGSELQRLFARAQAASLKTGNLQAAYLEAIDAIEQGNGQQALQKKLQAAFYEKVRYYAQRIAQTELHRNYMAREARLLLDDADVEYVQIRRSSGKRSHGRCICDLMAGSNRYGLGPGVYPKHAAPMPPYHPFCRCVASPRLDLTGRKTPQERGGADAYFLRKLGQGIAAQVMGSQAKAQAVLDGADAVDVHNAKVPDAYKVRTVGSV